MAIKFRRRKPEPVAVVVEPEQPVDRARHTARAKPAEVSPPLVAVEQPKSKRKGYTQSEIIPDVVLDRWPKPDDSFDYSRFTY